MVELKTESSAQTQRLAQILAREIKSWSGKKPLVLALEGELGSGKTTFAQGLVGALGIREKVLSPTFILLKIYRLPARVNFKHLIHIDCYRLDSPKDLLRLGFKNLLKDKDAILVIEWADRIKKLLPKNTLRVLFKHGGKSNQRILHIEV